MSMSGLPGFRAYAHKETGREPYRFFALECEEFAERKKGGMNPALISGDVRQFLNAADFRSFSKYEPTRI